MSFYPLKHWFIQWPELLPAMSPEQRAAEYQSYCDWINSLECQQHGGGCLPTLRPAGSAFSGNSQVPKGSSVEAISDTELMKVMADDIGRRSIWQKIWFLKGTVALIRLVVRYGWLVPHPCCLGISIRIQVAGKIAALIPRSGSEPAPSLFASDSCHQQLCRQIVKKHFFFFLVCIAVCCFHWLWRSMQCLHQWNCGT